MINVGNRSAHGTEKENNQIFISKQLNFKIACMANNTGCGSQTRSYPPKMVLFFTISYFLFKKDRKGLFWLRKPQTLQLHFLIWVSDFSVTLCKSFVIFILLQIHYQQSIAFHLISALTFLSLFNFYAWYHYSLNMPKSSWFSRTSKLKRWHLSIPQAHEERGILHEHSIIMTLAQLYNSDFVLLHPKALAIGMVILNITISKGTVP